VKSEIPDYPERLTSFPGGVMTETCIECDAMIRTGVSFFILKL
jgi:hypothetical protein